MSPRPARRARALPAALVLCALAPAAPAQPLPAAPLPKPAAVQSAVMPSAAMPSADLGATLDGLLAFARDRHPELRSMRHEADAAAQRATAAGALPDPMFQVELRDVTNEGSGGSFNLNPARVGATRYQLRQTLPAWGSRDARRAQAAAGADEATRRAEATWAELAMRIKTAYAGWQQATATLAQTHEILGLVDRLEAVAQARYAGGLAPQADVIRAQVERSTLAGEILMLDAELATLRARINGLLARPADAPLAPPREAAGEAALPTLAQLDAAALRERALARNPQLAAEDARLRAAESGKDAVWSNRYPEFTFGLAPIQMRNRIAEWELMFEVSIPLQQRSRRAEESEALSMVAAARARKEAIANELLAALGAQLAALEAARRVETLTRTSLLPQAELTFQAALAGYESAKLDFMTLIEAQRQIRQARVSLIKTRAEARMRLAEIERLLGGEL